MRIALAITAALLPTMGLAEKIDFTTQIQPIFSQNCYACHGPDEEAVESGLRLDVRELALKGAKTARPLCREIQALR